MLFRRVVSVIFIAIILIGGYISWKYFSQKKAAEVPKVYRIGMLFIDKDVQGENLKGFKAKFAELGFKEGVNVEYITRNAGADRGAILQGYADELNKMGLDLIISGSTSGIEPLKKLPDFKTKTYFLAAGRPRDLVANLQTPEGLITGIGEGTVEFSAKRVALLKEITPSIKTIISVVEAKHGNAKLFKENVAKAAESLGMKAVFIDIEKADEILKVLPKLTSDIGEAYIACPCQSNERYAKELAAQLKKEKILSINSEVSIGAKNGFLVTYSDDRYKSGEYAAIKVGEILKGKPISEVPVEFAKDVLLELNLKTAELIGIEIPRSIVSQANKTYNE